MEPQDHHLSKLYAAVAGDTEALAQLLVDHSGSLAHRLRTRLQLNPGIEFTVDDLLQEVFLDVVKGISSFRPDDGVAFSTWLNKVADNRLVTMLRSQSRKKHGGGFRTIRSDWPSGLTSSIAMLVQYLKREDSGTPSEIVAKEEIIAALSAELATLPDNQRSAIENHYLRDLSIESTAKKMSMTTGAVRGLLRRARKVIRERLGESSRWFSRK